MNTPDIEDIVAMLRTSAVGSLALALLDGRDGDAHRMVMEPEPAFVVEIARVLNTVGVNLHGFDEWRTRCLLVAAEGDFARQDLAATVAATQDKPQEDE
jgi:hypothetical protein